MATSGLDGTFKLWDIRMFKHVYSYNIRGKAAGNIAVSQKGVLAASFGPKIDVSYMLYLFICRFL